MDANINYKNQYYRFMEWFKKNHSLLYGKYWSNIIKPVDGSGIGVSDINMDDESYENLVDLVFDYNSNFEAS